MPAPFPDPRRTRLPAPKTSAPQTVWISPYNGRVVQTEDPIKIAKLVGLGWIRKLIPGSVYEQIKPQISQMDPPDPALPTNPARPTLTPEEQEALNNQIFQTNAASAADQETLLRAFLITQPGRDRSVTQTREDYGAKVLPITTAAAISGAGDHQANAELFRERVGRDRTLADLSDAQTSAEFQLSASQAETDFARQQQLQTLYSSFARQAQERFNNRTSTIFDWIQGL